MIVRPGTLITSSGASGEDATPGGAASALLLEDGSSSFLLEDGSGDILMES